MLSITEALIEIRTTQWGRGESGDARVPWNSILGTLASWASMSEHVSTVQVLLIYFPLSHQLRMISTPFVANLVS